MKENRSRGPHTGKGPVTEGFFSLPPILIPSSSFHAWSGDHTGGAGPGWCRGGAGVLGLGSPHPPGGMDQGWAVSGLPDGGVGAAGAQTWSEVPLCTHSACLLVLSAFLCISPPPGLASW